MTATYRRLRNPRGKYDYVVLDGVEGRDIIFRNFEGGPTPFNPNNKDKTFAVVIHDEAFAKSLEAEGWRIKWFEPKNDGDERTAYITVKIQFKPVTPKVFLENENGKHTRITESQIGAFDNADILSVKLALNGRQITTSVGKPYPKPYVAEMIITLAPSIFGIDDVDAEETNLDELGIDSDQLPF